MNFYAKEALGGHKERGGNRNNFHLVSLEKKRPITIEESSSLFTIPTYN